MKKRNLKTKIALFKLFILLVIGTLLVTSCSPERRLQRLLKKNPDLVDTTTIYVMDTLTIRGVSQSVEEYDSDTLNIVINTIDSARIHITKQKTKGTDKGKIKVDYKSPDKKIPIVRTETKIVNLSPKTIEKIKTDIKKQEEKKYKLEITLYRIAIILLILLALIIKFYEFFNSIKKKIFAIFTKVANQIFVISVISFSVILAAEFFNAIPLWLEMRLNNAKFILIAIAAASKYMVKKDLLTKDDIVHFWEKKTYVEDDKLITETKQVEQVDPTDPSLPTEVKVEQVLEKKTDA